MDQQKLRTLVFEKTGVKIDVDDPVFALVALNEAVLEEAVERHVALLNEVRESERFNVMEKQRIKVVFRDLFDQLDKVNW